MAKKDTTRLVDLLVFGLTVFLIFCLIFESFVSLPNLVSWLGRWHPLVLHFPIVIVLVVALAALIGKQIKKQWLVVAVLSVLVTAITGFFLGTETSSKGQLLFWHQWLGASMAFLTVVWYWLYTHDIQNVYLLKGIQAGLILLVGFTGHYGGMVTHGEEFLALPKSNKLKKIPDNPLIYEHVVGQILENNCVACHNENKKKGDYLMTGMEQIIAGGKTGVAMISGKPEESEFIRRLRLPVEDKEHMPPEGKKPLSENEMQILERWIALGISDTLRLNHLGANETLATLVSNMMVPEDKERWNKLPKVDNVTLQNLTSNYVNVKRIENSSEALSVSVFLPPEYNSQLVLNLKPIAENIVELDLSGLPVGATEMDFVATCKNLELLEIDRTPVTDIEVEKLKALTKLRALKVYGSKITDAGLPIITELKSLKRLYIWDTKISEVALRKVAATKPELKIDTGINSELLEAFIKHDTLKKEN
ncbi:c-type cytochrome domain-containing protein [Snuella sedimenti]|uniref:Cytochrome C Planctomycete-type domain-containing protein n=1 Tax=Snuella sedimenti TaxID=2798802 RepID=A0A8J7LP97_9FLAO|nr:c-type cytochrome domain-containing protein [Snuella sedimenti]MBJ6369043.1 hypothetical protein [Snuella sedimenti]